MRAMGWVVIAILAGGQLASTASAASRDDQFACGRYRVAGKLRVTRDGQDTLTLYPGTKRQFALLLLGLSHERAMAFDGESIQLEIEVTRSAAGAEVVGKVVRWIGGAPSRVIKQVPKVQISDLECGISR